MIYFFRCGDFVKIGVAADAEKRLGDIQPYCPYEITIEGTIDGSYWLESKIHAENRDKRRWNEWFSLSKEDVQRIIKENSSWERDNYLHSDEMFIERIAQICKKPNENGMVSASDVVRYGNHWRISRGEKKLNISAWLKTKKAMELCDMLGEDCVFHSKNDGVWVHPVMFVDLVLDIVPSVKAELFWSALKYANLLAADFSGAPNLDSV